MESITWTQVPISDFEIGLPLRYDIFSDAGAHLASVGDDFTSGLMQIWIQSGFSRVYARVRESVDDSVLLTAYDQQVISSLQNNLKLAVEVLNIVAASNSEKIVGITNMEFEEVSVEIINSIQRDISAALFVLAESLTKADKHKDADAIAERSSQLSLLSMTIAYELGLVPFECQLIGTAALLHDISLMSSAEQGSDPIVHYQQHPLISAKVINSIVGINPKTVIIASQVHERPDGNGFPRKLSKTRILHSSRIVALADAYLTLTLQRQAEILPPARFFHPTDALAYLMFQASQGIFDSEMVKALIRAASLYPVHSSVILSNQESATVFRSSRSDATKPIVRIDSSNELMDLRHTGISIAGPNRTIRPYNILRKVDMNQILWI